MPPPRRRGGAGGGAPRLNSAPAVGILRPRPPARPLDPLDLLTPAPAGRFATPPERNAYVELHNLIAAAESVDEFSPSDRGRISRRHGVDLTRAFRDERAAVYRAVLDHRLGDGDLDAEDRRVLGHIARTLALSAEDLRAAHERAFGKTAVAAVEDDGLSSEERLLLYKLQHVLGLDPDLADGAYGVIARERLLRVVARVLCDGELSADEEAEVRDTQRALGIAMPPDIEAMLSTARARWRVRRGVLGDVSVPVPTADGEAGRLVVEGSWCFVSELRLRHAVGEDTLHAGRTSGLAVPRRALRGRNRAGQIVLTTRRLVLAPDDSAVPDAYRLDTIAQLLRFRDGTIVRTQSEQRLALDPGDDNDVFYSVLYRLVFGDPD